jgi:hypothetical protein
MPKVTRDSRLGACSPCARKARMSGLETTWLTARSARSLAPVNAFHVCQPTSAMRGRRSIALRNVTSDRTAFDVTAAGRGARKKTTFQKLPLTLHGLRDTKSSSNIGALQLMKAAQLALGCLVRQHDVAGVEP